MGETMDPPRLNSDDIAGREPCSIATAIAVSLTFFGAVT